MVQVTSKFGSDESDRTRMGPQGHSGPTHPAAAAAAGGSPGARPGNHRVMPQRHAGRAVTESRGPARAGEAESDSMPSDHRMMITD
eukprot:644696-Hanusia_phi.AAC.1